MKYIIKPNFILALSVLILACLSACKSRPQSDVLSRTGVMSDPQFTSAHTKTGITSDPQFGGTNATTKTGVMSDPQFQDPSTVTGIKNDPQFLTR